MIKKMITQFFEPRPGPAPTPMAAPRVEQSAEEIRAMNLDPTFTDRGDTKMTKEVFLPGPRPKPIDTYKFANHVVEGMQGVGDGCFLYETMGSPMASMGAKNRGDCVEAIVKEYCAQHDYGAYEVLPAEITTGRAANTTTTDFRLKHKETGIVITVEVKSARMTFARDTQLWCLQWENVKKGVAELILLCVEHFDHVDIYVLDSEFTGYSTNGKKEVKKGGYIKTCGPWKTPDHVASYKEIHKKLNERYLPFAKLEFEDEPAKSTIANWGTRGHECMATMPLFSLSGASRGDVADRLVQDHLRRKGCNVQPAPPGVCVNGQSTNVRSTPCDFLVDGKRAESKAAMMNWDDTNKLWSIQFQSIDKSKHDLLYFSFFSPKAMHVILYDHRASTSTSKYRSFYAPRGMVDIKQAEKHLLKLLAKFRGFRYLARFDFYEGDAAKVKEIGVRNGVWSSSSVDEEEDDDEEVEEEEASDSDEPKRQRLE